MDAASTIASTPLFLVSVPAAAAGVRAYRAFGERAASLTRQLLAFSRQVLQPKVLDLGSVVANAKGLLHPVVGEDTRLVTVTSPSLGRVKAAPAIWAASEPGRGTTFKIYLPRLEEEVTSAAPSGLPAASPRGTETVLLVEDQDLVQKLVKQVLEMNGYTVLATSSGVEALDLAARHGGPIHVLLTDVVMPEMNGRKVADRIAALRPGLRVLYISGYSADVVTRHGVLEEGVAFLQKPFRPDALARKMRELLD